MRLAWYQRRASIGFCLALSSSAQTVLHQGSDALHWSRIAECTVPSTLCHLTFHCAASIQAIDRKAFKNESQQHPLDGGNNFGLPP
jgi:hypothetical protein